MTIISVDLTVAASNPTGDAARKWRAVLRIPPQIKWGIGVNGTMTEEGPWVEGFGYSAEGAITNAMTALGRAVMAMDHEPPIKAAGGAG